MASKHSELGFTTEMLLRFASHTKLMFALYILDFFFCTIGYMFLENATLGDSLWWCTVTWFTVGYGDSVPLTGYGRLFGMFAIISSHVLIILVTANFISKLTQYRKDAVAADRAKESNE